MKKINLVLCVILLSISKLLSQSAWTNYKEIYNECKQIVIDSKNNKWIATRYKGLFKFDGNKWTNYDTTNCGIVSNSISQIVIDSQNNMWIGTDKGLNKFDGSTWTNYNKINDITQLVIDSKGNKWIGTIDNGLFKFDGATWTNYNTTNCSITSNFISQIVIDSQNNMWIGTENGLNKFDGYTWTNYIESYDNCTKIVLNSKGDIWIGTSSTGLYKFDGTTWTHFNTNNSGIASNYISQIIIDKQNNMWIGTDKGLTKFNGSTWINYNNVNMITQIIIDSKDNKWIGTSDNGLYKFDETIWTNYNTKNSWISHNYINHIVMDSQGDKWICTTEGLDKLEGTGTSKICGMKLITLDYSVKKVLQCKGSYYLLKVKNQSNYSFNWFGRSSSDGNRDVLIKSNSDSLEIQNGMIYAALSDSFCANRDVTKNIFLQNLQDTMVKIPSICMITNQNNYNLVVWENINNDYVSKYRIYKQNQINSQYDLVHEQSKHEISQWLDTLSNTNTINDRYKISILYSCGKETPLSNNHTTILLSSNLGLNGTVNLSWNPYIGFEYPTFEIWRSTDGTNFIKIAYVANNSFAYIDNNPPATAWYQIRISKQNSCDPSSRGITSVNSNIISKDGKTLELINKDLENISIFPNPSDGKYILKTSTTMIGKTFNLLDISGRFVQTGIINTYSQNINIENIENGTYFLSFDNNTTIKLIKE